MCRTTLDSSRFSAPIRMHLKESKRVKMMKKTKNIIKKKLI